MSKIYPGRIKMKQILLISKKIKKIECIFFRVLADPKEPKSLNDIYGYCSHAIHRSNLTQQTCETCKKKTLKELDKKREDFNFKFSLNLKPTSNIKLSCWNCPNFQIEEYIPYEQECDYYCNLGMKLSEIDDFDSKKWTCGFNPKNKKKQSKLKRKKEKIL